MSQSSSTQRLVLVVAVAVIGGVIAAGISDSIWFGIVIAGVILAVIAWIARPRLPTPHRGAPGHDTGSRDTGYPVGIAADGGDRGRDDDRDGNSRDDSDRGDGDGSGDDGRDGGSGDSGGGDSGGGGDSSGGGGDGGSSSGE